MSAHLAPFPKFRAFDSNGDPLVGGKLYTYVAGGSTPATTYTDSTGNVANANPVVLDANGEASVWLDPGVTYKFVLKDSADVTQWTVDQIPGSLSATVSNLNGIRFANQFSGADLGAKINAADTDLGATSGEIWVTSPGTISTAVSLSANHTLRFFPGGYTQSAAITIRSGCSVFGSGLGMSGRGTCFTVNTVGLDGIIIAAGAVGGTVEGIGFDGTSRTNLLGSAIKFAAGDVSTVSNRWYVRNISVLNWKGKGIDLADYTSDNHFDNITMSSCGATAAEAGTAVPSFYVGNHANANMGSNIQIDGSRYCGVQEASTTINAGGGLNLFTNLKIDANDAPVGTHCFLVTGICQGLVVNGFNFRVDADAAASGVGINITATNADWMSFAHGTIHRASDAPAGTTAVGINVVATAIGLTFDDIQINDCATGIADASPAGSNLYTNIRTYNNTADLSFSNLQNADVTPYTGAQSRTVVGSLAVTSGVTGATVTGSTSVSTPSEIVTGGNGATWTKGSASELVTIAAAASSDSVANLLPANSIIEAVVVRVTVVIPTAATFTVGDATTAARFATGVAVAANTTAVGLLHQQGGIASDATGPVQTSAAKVRITPNLAPGDATGRVRVTVFYKTYVAPTS